MPSRLQQLYRTPTTDLADDQLEYLISFSTDQDEVEAAATELDDRQDTRKSCAEELYLGYERHIVA